MTIQKFAMLHRGSLSGLACNDLDSASTQRDVVSDAKGIGRQHWSRQLVSLIAVWSERSKQRAQLSRIASEPKVLMDLGLLNYDVINEGRKPFWRE